jgi:hypothetical protein
MIDRHTNPLALESVAHSAAVDLEAMTAQPDAHTGQHRRGGPQTESGKAIASMNAARLGIFARPDTLARKFEADAQFYQTTLAELNEQYKPEKATDILGVQELAMCYTRLRRLWAAGLALTDEVNEREMRRRDMHRAELRAHADPLIDERIFDPTNDIANRYKKAQRAGEALDAGQLFTDGLAIDALINTAEFVDVRTSEIIGRYVEYASYEEKKKAAREIFRQLALRLAKKETGRISSQMRQRALDKVKAQAQKELAEAKALYTVRLSERECVRAIGFFADDKTAERLSKYERHLTRRINELQAQLENSKTNWREETPSDVLCK